MDVPAATQLISNVGFPIAMCLCMMWFINDSNKRHSDEINQLKESINNNTIAMTKLIDRLGGEGKAS